MQGGEKWGRFSIIGLPCSTILRVSGNNVSVITDEIVQEEVETDDPFGFISDFKSRFNVAVTEDDHRFIGGLVGYFSYDAVRFVEPTIGPNLGIDQIETPDILLMLSEEVVVFDNLRGTISFVINVDSEKVENYKVAQARLDELQEMLKCSALLPNSKKVESDAKNEFQHHFDLLN